MIGNAGNTGRLTFFFICDISHPREFPHFIVGGFDRKGWTVYFDRLELTITHRSRLVDLHHHSTVLPVGRVTLCCLRLLRYRFTLDFFLFGVLDYIQYSVVRLQTISRPKTPFSHAHRTQVLCHDVLGSLSTLGSLPVDILRWHLDITRLAVDAAKITC